MCPGEFCYFSFQRAAEFAENKLDLFGEALELIVDSETGFASSTNTLNLVDQFKDKKLKKEAEPVLQKFMHSKQLIEKGVHSSRLGRPGDGAVRLRPLPGCHEDMQPSATASSSLVKAERHGY